MQAVDEVDERRHALADHAHLGRAPAGSQVVVPVGDARVDDRDADAGAVVAPLLLDGARADRDGRASFVPRDRTIVVDDQDLRALGDRLDDAVREFDDHAVDELQPASRTAAELLISCSALASCPGLIVRITMDVPKSRLERDFSPGRAFEAARPALLMLGLAWLAALPWPGFAATGAAARSGRASTSTVPRSATNVDAIENAFDLFLWLPSEPRKWSQSLADGYPPVPGGGVRQ